MTLHTHEGAGLVLAHDPTAEARATALIEAVSAMCAVIANRVLLVEAVANLVAQHLGGRCAWVEAADGVGDWRHELRVMHEARVPVIGAGSGGQAFGFLAIALEAGRGVDGLTLVALTAATHTLALSLERLARDEARARVVAASEREAQRWLSVLEAAGHGAWEWNVVTGQVTYSRQWKTMLGYAEDELEDHLDAWSSRVHPDDLGTAMVAVMRHLEGKTPFYRSEHRIRCKDGSYRWVLDLGKVVVRDADGRALFAMGTHTDVTDRKLAEAKLDALEEAHAVAEAVAHLGSWRWEIGAGSIDWSAEVFRIFGVDPGRFEPTYDTFMAAVHVDDREAVASALRRATEGVDDAYDIEHRVVRPGGEVRWVRERGTLARDASGAPMAMSGMVHDITEVRRHQHRLAFLARRAEVLLELQSHAREHDEASVLRLAAVRLGALVSSGCARIELLHPNGGASTHAATEDCACGGDPPTEVRILDAGRVRMVLGSGTPTEDDDDDRETLSVVGREVWRLVRELREEAARTEAEVKFRAIAEQSVAGIYLVSERRITWINQRGAAILGREPEDLIGRSVFELIAEEDHPQLMAREAARMHGRIVDERVVVRARHRDDREVFIAIGSNAIELQGRRVVVGVVQDVTEARQAERRAQGYLERLERSVVGTLEVISRMMSLRDPYTSGHERRVGEIAAAIGVELGLAADRCAGLRFAGLVHDVGKITAPAEILSKPGRLTPTEYALIKTHAEHGYEILKGIDFPWPVAEVARQHHERMDGSGYPDGRVGEAILLEARIVAVADVVESMGSHRPYRPALGIDAALAEIEKGAGRLYDPAVAAACIRLFRERGMKLPA